MFQIPRVIGQPGIQAWKARGACASTTTGSEIRAGPMHPAAQVWLAPDRPVEGNVQAALDPDDPIKPFDKRRGRARALIRPQSACGDKPLTLGSSETGNVPDGLGIDRVFADQMMRETGLGAAFVVIMHSGCSLGSGLARTT